MKHTETLRDLDFDDIVDAALNECVAIIARDVATRARMPDSGDELPPRNDRTALVCAAHLKREYSEHFLSKKGRFRKKASGLHEHVTPEVFFEAERILFPDARELTPFIVALAAIFGLNSSTVVGMTIDDWEERTLLGVRRLRLYPKKARAGRRQRFEISITDEADHPFHLLEYVKARTQPLRDMYPEYCRRLLFVRLGQHPRQVRDMVTSSTLPDDALGRFIRDNELVTFTLRQLRPTAMDRVHEVTGDLMRTQAFANHASPTTTERNYPSAARTRRNMERLGRAMEYRHRDISTDWKISSFEIPADLDKAAATPGFGCLNPYLGEIETEQPGRLCAAYGHCAGCRLAKVDYGSPRACAYLHQLRERIDEAQAIIGAEAWLARWAPVKRELLLKIDRFSPAARAEAASIIVTRLPSVE